MNIKNRQQNEDKNNPANGIGRASDPAQMNTPRLQRMDTYERIVSIDHKKRSEQLRQQNPVKQRDKYGDPFMRYLGIFTFLREI